MKKLLALAVVFVSCSVSVQAIEESNTPQLVELEEVKEITMMYRGLEMDLENLEDEMDEVSQEVKELKKAVKDLTETCEKIQKEVVKKDK